MRIKIIIAMLQIGILPVFSLAQQVRLVLDGAYISIQGGTVSNSVFLVVDGRSTGCISRLTAGGHIYTQGQYDFMKWNADTGTGSYVFPFGIAGNAADYIPFTFNKIDSENSNIIASTWSTNQQNVPHPGISNVSAVYAMRGVGDSVTTAVDRFWDVRTSALTTAHLTFSYKGSENTTTQSGLLKVQKWNGYSCSLWSNPVGPGNAEVTTGIGTVGPVTNIRSFSPFVLTIATDSLKEISIYPLANAGADTIKAYLDLPVVLGGDPTAICGTEPYTYSWSPATFLSSTTEANPTATPTANITYSLTVTDANNHSSKSTVTLVPTAIPDASFATLTRKLDGSYYSTANGGDLFFKYDEEYNDVDNKLTFNVYNQYDNALIYSETNKRASYYGDNRYALPLRCLGGCPLSYNGFYLLEVINEKQEKYYLRFKYVNNSNALFYCGGCDSSVD